MCYMIILHMVRGGSRKIQQWGFRGVSTVPGVRGGSRPLRPHCESAPTYGCYVQRVCRFYTMAIWFPSINSRTLHKSANILSTWIQLFKMKNFEDKKVRIQFSQFSSISSCVYVSWRKTEPAQCLPFRCLKNKQLFYPS